MFGKRKSDLEKLADRQAEKERGPRYVDDSGPVMSYARDRGVRETFESILIAIVLALLFRNFLGEAYIIPTGSMANGLQGRHYDLRCEKCDFEYRTGASEENNRKGIVKATICPICRYVTKLKPQDQSDHRSFAGDRILVNKFIYDYQSPERWDVIVFKYPNNGKQNYIKRCVGLPGEKLLIEQGDVYTFDPETEGFADRRIARKDPRKLLAMLQLVDDTDFIAEELKRANWPSRWQQWGQGQPSWKVHYPEKGGQEFEIAGTSGQMEWLRYRHAVPRHTEWTGIEKRELPERLDSDFAGELITDFYCYNEKLYELSIRDQKRGYAKVLINELGKHGLHWVGDLAVECQVQVESDSGSIAFDIVEGGVHFTCTIDLQSGEARLAASGDSVQFFNGAEVVDGPTANTPVKGQGSYFIRFANADDQLYLWVNDRSIDLGITGYKRTGKVVPKYSAADPGDAEPLGVGSQGATVKIDHIRVLRDIYYTSDTSGEDSQRSIQMEYDRVELEPILETLDPEWRRKARLFRYETDFTIAAAENIQQVLRTPALWSTDLAKRLFACQERDESDVFHLKKFPNDPRKDQFMPMGDNSPRSSDARVWGEDHYVERSFLLGRAMYIYWPHAKTKPIPFTPNFARMKLIR